MIKIIKKQLINNNFCLSFFSNNWSIQLSFLYLGLANKLVIWNYVFFSNNLNKITNIFLDLLEKKASIFIFIDNKITNIIANKNFTNFKNIYFKINKGFLTNFKNNYTENENNTLFPSFIFSLDVNSVKLKQLANECLKVQIPLSSIVNTSDILWGISYPLTVNIKSLNILYFFLKYLKQIIVLGYCLEQLSFEEEPFFVKEEIKS